MRSSPNCTHRLIDKIPIRYIANVDWALVNFMQDWFSEEAEAKQKNNEKEAAKEQLQELGLDTGCVIE